MYRSLLFTSPRENLYHSIVKQLPFSAHALLDTMIFTTSDTACVLVLPALIGGGGSVLPRGTEPTAPGLAMFSTKDRARMFAAVIVAHKVAQRTEIEYR